MDGGEKTNKKKPKADVDESKPTPGQEIKTIHQTSETGDRSQIEHPRASYPSGLYHITDKVKNLSMIKDTLIDSLGFSH